MTMTVENHQDVDRSHQDFDDKIDPYDLADEFQKRQSQINEIAEYMSLLFAFAAQQLDDQDFRDFCLAGGVDNEGRSGFYEHIDKPDAPRRPTLH
jgi:hypothetical protein